MTQKPGGSFAPKLASAPAFVSGRGFVLGTCAIFAATLAAYYPCWHGTFVWDDDAWTSKLQPLFTDFSGWQRIWTDTTAMQQYYPMTGTTFWIDHRLWGEWTLPYHLENILLHAGSAVLFWRLLRRLDVPGAGLAGAVFALHPVMAESVAWITERKNVLSLFFFLAALHAYGRFESFGSGSTLPAGRPGAYAWSLGLYLCALLSKITAFAFPPAILLLAWWKRGRIRWRLDVLPLIPFFVLTVALGLHTEWLERHHVGAQGAGFSATLPERLIVAGWSFWFYPWKLLWPANLCFVYPKWTVDTSSVAQWLIPVSAALALAALWLCRSRTGRGPVAAVFFYVGSLFPVMGLMNAYGALFSHVWDHWVYLPSLGLVALGSATAVRLARRLARPVTVTVATGAILCVLAPITWMRSAQFRDKETLWRETIARNPACPLAHNNLGVDLAAAGRLDDAIASYERALDAKPDFAEAHNNIGCVLLRKRQTDDAVVRFLDALAINPGYVEALNNLGSARIMQGRPAEAVDAFRRVLAAAPRNAAVHNNLGVALLRSGKVDEAARAFEESLVISPDYADALVNLGNARMQSGREADALACYRRAIEAQPNQPDAHYNLGNERLRAGDLDQAAAHFRSALSGRPQFVDAHIGLGNTALQLNRLDEALDHYRAALALKPGYPDGENNVGYILFRLGRREEAVEHYGKALAANPAMATALTNLSWALATSPEDALRNGPRAMEVAGEAVRASGGNDPLALASLAAAHAECSRFVEAAEIAGTAARAATRENDAGLAAEILAQQEVYRSGRPFRVVDPPRKAMP